MKSVLRRFSLPAIRRQSCTPEVDKPVSILQSIQSTNEEELQADKLCQFKQAVKCFDIPKELDSYDFYYIKWLRARGYDIEKAKEMLRKHLEWRASCTYLHGAMNYIAPNEVLEEFKWKRLGNDSKGRPIICILAGRIDVHYLLENNLFEDVKRYAHKVFDMLQMMSDEQRKLTGYGKVIGIADMTGFTFAKAMNVEFLQFAIYMARTFEAHYPESLYRAYAIHTNWFCTTVYNTIKPFLAQETIDKVQIYGHDQEKYLPALESTIPIELIPEEYGGTGDSIEHFDIIP